MHFMYFFFVLRRHQEVVGNNTAFGVRADVRIHIFSCRPVLVGSFHAAAFIRDQDCQPGYQRFSSRLKATKAVKKRPE